MQFVGIWVFYFLSAVPLIHLIFFNTNFVVLSYSLIHLSFWTEKVIQKSTNNIAYSITDAFDHIFPYTEFSRWLLLLVKSSYYVSKVQCKCPLSKSLLCLHNTQWSFNVITLGQCSNWILLAVTQENDCVSMQVSTPPKEASGRDALMLIFFSD